MIYIAAPLSLAARARASAVRIHALGGRVCSTWHDRPAERELDLASKPPWAIPRLETNLCELARAKIVLALTHSKLGRETYVEIGRALARSIPVVWSTQDGGLALSFCSGLVGLAPTDDAAERLAVRLVRAQ